MNYVLADFFFSFWILHKSKEKEKKKKNQTNQTQELDLFILLTSRKSGTKAMAGAKIWAARLREGKSVI